MNEKSELTEENYRQFTHDPPAFPQSHRTSIL